MCVYFGVCVETFWAGWKYSKKIMFTRIYVWYLYGFDANYVFNVFINVWIT